MYLIQQESLGEDTNTSESQKCCTDCKTTKTPLWRGGPAGPKTLCNACGIRHRKKRDMMVWKKELEKKKERISNGISAAAAATTTTACNTCGGGVTNENSLRKSLKIGLMALDKEVVLLQRQRSSIVRKQRRRRREIGEEEQAALLLMALSCGSVFA